MSKFSATLPLWDSLPYETATPLKVDTPLKQQALWLAVCLPKLALEVVEVESPAEVSVVIEESGQKRVIHTASAAAERLGITTGLSLAAAYSIYPNLAVYEFDKTAQQQRLHELASWAMQFSSKVNLNPPCSLLLEVQGSIKYFGSLAAIQEKIEQGLTEKWRHTFYQATTPTPAASLMLAESGRDLVVKRREDLRSALGQLSVDSLPLDNKRKKQLNKTGVRVLRDVWRLPSDGLARRFGIDLVNYLDRATGKQADLLSTYQLPPYFTAEYDIPFEAHNYQLLLPLARELLSDLCNFLIKHDLYASRYSLYFSHQYQSDSVIHIDSRQAIRQPEKLFMLLETKLSQLQFVAPVIRLKLYTDRLHAYIAQNTALFSRMDTESSNRNIDELLDTLTARLGYEALNYIGSYPDHRPEKAWRNKTVKDEDYHPPTKQRPLWLLSHPRQLLKKNNGVYYKSLVRFIAGPERIQTGWWDKADIYRDYYVGLDKVAGNIWIYHDLAKKQQWYLHGLFG